MKRLIDEFSRFVARHRIPAAARHDMYVALDEILSNAVKHRRATGARISLHLVFERGVLQATVRDNGAAFNPLSRPRPRTDQPLLERPIGGLGLLLVTELMDDVTYLREAGRNCVVLTKRVVQERRP